MDNLSRLNLLFAIADGSFLHGLLGGLHLPTSAEGWGTTLGATLLLIASQLLQGHLSARKWRAFALANMPAPKHQPKKQSKRGSSILSRRSR